MASNDETKSLVTLTQIFNYYVTNILSQLSDKQVKMSNFYDYVDKEYSIEKLDLEIVTNNVNIKSIYFNESRWENLEFKIFESNDIEIVINEKHKIANLSMLDCNNIDLIFESESSQAFIYQNNFLFQKCTFKTIDIRFPELNKNQFAFNYKLNFLNCEIGKMDRIENKEFNNNIIFKNTTFLNSFVGFSNKIFNNDISFQTCVFEKEAYFLNSTFEKIAFLSTEFEDNVYFNKSKFNILFALEETKFAKAAKFFKAEFHNFFDLSFCSFKEPESLNFSSLKINTNIKILEANINEIAKAETEIEKNRNKKDSQEKTKGEYETIMKKQQIILTETLRDSFAFIKHNFIQRNNLIEAQKYKIAEFYAEELRLKYECEIKERCWLESLIAFPKATINFLQLLFYRHTSNHHSDLLKSFNTMLLLIGLFGLFTSAIILSFNCCYLDTFATSIHSNIELYNTHIKHYIIAHEGRLIFINFGITFGFLLIFFILCICFQNKISRFIVVSLSYVFSILLLLFSPKSIISITNLFSGNQHILDPLSALSGIYTILFILLIYSLQKTSRRNSIM